jgi:flagellar motor switch protein FliN/FliY
MIALDCRQEDPTLAYVGDLLVACGDVLLNGDKVSLRITEIINEVA